MLSKVTFEIHPVCKVLDLLTQLEEEIHPSMRLTEPAKEMILGSEGIAVLCTDHKNNIIGAGYAVSSLEAVAVLGEVDPKFAPEDNQIYIYSVVVARLFRRMKIGTFIRQMLLKEAKGAGYVTGTTHVRISNGWDDAGEKLYKPILLTRVLKNFWPELPDPHVKFMLFKL